MNRRIPCGIDINLYSIVMEYADDGDLYQKITEY
jgi:hypothetical protein